MDEKEKQTTEEETPAQNTTEEETQQNEPISDFLNNPDVIAYIEKQVAEGVKKALQGTPPKANTTPPAEHDKKSFDKMTYKERLNLFKSNPQVYNALAKGKK